MGCKMTKRRKQKVKEKHSLIRNHPNDDQEQLPINMEGITLIWCDTNIDLDTDDDNEDIHHTMELLKESNDFILFFSNEKKCTDYIKSIENEKLFLITSGKCAIHLLPLIHQHKQIDSIYLFCLKQKPYEYLLKDYSKIIGIYTQQQELIDSIRKNVYIVEKHMATFTFYDKTKQNSIRDLFNEPASFLWLLLFKDVITRIPNDNQAKQELVEKCLEYYHGNQSQIKFIEEFKQTYKPEDAIKWYTKPAFVYKLINKALRTEDIEQLYIFRYFISDLCENLKKEYQIIKENFDIITVYHGGRLRDDELEKLKNHKNQPISTNGFFSTSLSKETAFLFAARFSDIPDEDEVLFEIGATFEVLAINHDETLNMWIVKLKTTDKGSKIANDYIETNRKEMNESSSKIMFGKLLSEVGKYDKSQEYFENLLANPKDEDIAEIYSCIGTTKRLKGEYDDALKDYQRTYTMIINTRPERSKDLLRLLNNMGKVYMEKDQQNEALDYYLRALKVRTDALGPEYFDRDIAILLNNIGLIYYYKGDWNKSLEYHFESVNMKQKCFPNNHKEWCASYHNIALVYQAKCEYNTALEYMDKALKIEEQYYLPDSERRSLTYTTIGNILNDQGEYEKALEYQLKSLNITEKLFPLGHPSLAFSLNNTADVYEKMHNLNIALEYYERALIMYKQFLPKEHLDIVRTEEDIILLKEKRKLQQQHD
ncbi:unnamed protein product [Didymodactylos carnosus]|uniref:Uncharacterized protein n=1 Tax=Didymodactylos carnosus TaxID=1234261 RepID=A0A814WWQ3_9BILA|nr:unnamed protein product [Didymodactylos carnosus]CAF3973941.1 unnamed protein product [Didymodactylos carnosus]